MSSSQINVFGDDFVGVGGKNKKFLRITPRFMGDDEPMAMATSPEMTLGDPNIQSIPSFSRILMSRECKETVPLYNHSGVIWKLMNPEGNISSYLLQDGAHPSGRGGEKRKVW